MKRISVLIKPASSLCNIKCRYCFYHDISSLREVNSFGRMTKALAKKMIDQIYVDLENGDSLSLTFQGGEPTLAGLSYYRFLIDCVKQQTKEIRVSYAIQTNGMVINRKWCELFKEHDFLVGLSMDGPALFHDSGRVDWQQRGTFQRVKETKKLLDEYQISYNILTVLTNELAKHPEKVCSFLREEQIEYIQFIPCLAALSEDHQHSFGLTPELFASFYKRLHQFWLNELANQHYISIKLFDDLFHLVINRQITACGINGRCSVQYVIEGDGSVYPCDFFVTDAYKLGNIKEHTLKELFSQPISQTFLCHKRAVTSYCLDCPYSGLCGGGCRRMRETIYVNSSQTYCGFQDVLSTYTKDLEKVVNEVRGLGK